MGQTTILNQIVDTLKLQFYPNGRITLDEIDNYNNIVEKFINIKKQAMEIKAHDNQSRYIVSKIDGYNFRVMATTQTSFNVTLQSGDISIALLKHSSRSNNPLVKVEFRSEFLLRMGYVKAIKAVERIISTILDNYHVKVSELHLATDIQGYNFTELDFHRIKSTSKTKVIHDEPSQRRFYGKTFTGFSLGKGDEMLRIYNKTIEINQNKKKGFISVLAWQHNPNFDPNQTVWRIEFQIRRAKLKTLLSKSGLLDSLTNVSNSIADIWSYFVTKYIHKNFSPKMIQEQMLGFKVDDKGNIIPLNSETLRKRFQRAESSNLWDSIQTFNDIKGYGLNKYEDIKKPEVEYVKNAYKALLSTFVKLKRGEFKSSELTKILLEADEENKDKKGYSLIDGARIKALDYISKAKFYYEKHGLIMDGFDEYQRDFKDNIFTTFALIENDPSNLLTFKEFNKRLIA